jgi:uncharacterized membrane-anchored protein
MRWSCLKPPPWHDNGMGRFRRTRPTQAGDHTIRGAVRSDRDLRALARKLRPGDVAVIDMMDIGQRSAEELARCRPAAVINAQASISGRYPTGGPLVLVDAGIPVVDNVGAEVMRWKDGTEVSINGGRVTPVEGDAAEGTRLDREGIDRAMAEAAEGMHVQLASFTANAMDVVAHDAGILLGGKDVPNVGIDLAGKQVVVVAPGYRYAEQLASIKRYMREHKPVLIAVSEAADVAAANARTPAVIVGNVESVSETALTAAKAIVVHDPSANEAGLNRVESLGLEHDGSKATIASADLAVLIASAGGAAVIVTVGFDTRLIDFLEQGRSDMAGTFLARLQAGPSIVDASTLALVYRHRYSWWTLVALVLSGVAALAVAVAVTPGGPAWWRGVVDVVATWIGVA